MHIQTKRLELFACSAEAAQAILRNRANLEALLGARVSEDWPTEDLQEFLPLYVQRLQADPSLLGWGVWLMVHRAEQKIIGDLGFKGRPDPEGTVEIGCSVVPAYRRQGYAFEAVRALAHWAFAQKDVEKITAECDIDNTPSIRILERLGFQRRETVGNLLRWELKKAQIMKPE